MEQVAYNREVSALLIACDLPVADLRATRLAHPVRFVLMNSAGNRNADAGQTSRINVAHFIAELLTAEAAWEQWKGRMPMIYNQG